MNYVEVHLEEDLCLNDEIMACREINGSIVINEKMSGEVRMYIVDGELYDTETIEDACEGWDSTADYYFPALKGDFDSIPNALIIDKIIINGGHVKKGFPGIEVAKMLIKAYGLGRVIMALPSFLPFNETMAEEGRKKLTHYWQRLSILGKVTRSRTNPKIYYLET